MTVAAYRRKPLPRGPTLETLHMIEQVLRASPRPLRLTEIKALLPRKVGHPTLREAIEHYKRLGCATEGSKGVMWTKAESGLGPLATRDGPEGPPGVPRRGSRGEPEARRILVRVTILRVADTSFLYAVLSSSDRFHADAVAEVNKPEPILIPSEIFSETLALVHDRVGFKAARDAGRWLRAQVGVQVPPSSHSILEGAWALFVRRRGRLSYPDAIVLAWCASVRGTPLAYDKAITG